MTNLNVNYTKEGIELRVLQEGRSVVRSRWLDLGVSVTVYNVITDLLVNELALKVGDGVYCVDYPKVPMIDRVDLDDLGVAPYYPYDLFVSYSGPSLLNDETVFSCIFQDYAGQYGTGNLLATADELTGAYLGRHGGYILSDAQYRLVSYINHIGNVPPRGRLKRLEAVAELQRLITEAGAVAARSLLEQQFEVVRRLEVDLEEVGPDQYRLIPKIDSKHSDAFAEVVGSSRRAKKSYVSRSGQKVEYAIVGESEDGSQLVDEVGKLQKVYTRQEVSAIQADPGRYFDLELLDLDIFGQRVIELGAYQPRFHPFISAYQSEWTPGLIIDDPYAGRRRFEINTEEALEELRNVIEVTQQAGRDIVKFKGEDMPLSIAEELCAIAGAQLSDPSSPIDAELGNGQGEGRKVLIIKENIDALSYGSDSLQVLTDFGQVELITGLRSGIQLKEHQTAGVRWLQNMLRRSDDVPGVLLADDMGLGKTLQVLYFIEWYTRENKKPILVVAPVSLLQNWEAEYDKFFPDHNLEVHRVWGREAKQHIVANDPRASKSLLSQPGVYLTTYETMRYKQLHFAVVDWGLVIMDEVQKIKTPGTMVTNAAKALKHDFAVAMTGTPVENSLMDLWCIMDFCYPGLLHDAKSFSQKYIGPQDSSDVDKVDLSRQLRDTIGHTLMRRLKRDVAKDLPPIAYHSRPVPMPSEQYQRYVSTLNKFQDQSEGEGGGKQGAFQLLFAIRRVSDHPYSGIMDLERISVDRLIETSAKLKDTVDILTSIHSAHEKAIIFTESKEIQRLLRRVVASRFGCQAVIVNGETPSQTSKRSSKLSRQDYIDTFQATPGFGVIIMSPLAAGVGLNITEANHVIHYTRHWNPAKEQQATDRAYRIGQTRPVQVYYPLAVAPNHSIKTFDQVLDELLQRKRELAHITLYPSDQIEVSQQETIDAVRVGVKETVNDLVQQVSYDELIEFNPRYRAAAVACLLEEVKGGAVSLNPKRKYGVDLIWRLEAVTTYYQIETNHQNIRPIPRGQLMDQDKGESRTLLINVSNEGSDDLSETFDVVYSQKELQDLWGSVALSWDKIEGKLANHSG